MDSCVRRNDGVVGMKRRSLSVAGTAMPACETELVVGTPPQ